MVNAAALFRSRLAVLLLAAGVLSLAAWTRGAEYDEQYTLFLTAGTARPAWPDQPFPAGLARAIQAGHADWAAIARDLRAGDVHPPLYFWAVAAWRHWTDGGLFTARLLSVGFGLGALALVGTIARTIGASPALGMLLTLGCYGFAYTSVIARGFALAQLLTLAGVALVLARGGRGGAIAAGLAFGAATLSNYLSVFVALAAAALAPPRRGLDAPGIGPPSRSRNVMARLVPMGFMHRRTEKKPPPPLAGGGGLASLTPRGGVA